MRPKFLSNSWLVIICAFWAGACVKQYSPDIPSIGKRLIVEGMITDQPGPYVIKLSYTTDYSFASLNYLVYNASVVISDDAGTTEVLQQLSPGVYQTRTGGLRGVAGRTYKLTVKTTDGHAYESAPELLKASPPIQAIYYEYTYHPTAPTNDKRNQWDVYIDTQDPETTGDYYRWQWKNYEALSSCRVSPDAAEDGYYTGVACCSPCWDINQCYTNCLSLRSDTRINGNLISRQYIMSAPFTSLTTYYVEVEQQRISKGAFQFFNTADKLVSNTGGIFDAAPVSLGGNIRCTSHPDEAAYGYFGAAGVAVRALKIDRVKDAVGDPVGKKIRIDALAGCAACVESAYRTGIKPRWWDN